mmetsp:Transcript_45080/g.97889  ORF Transcript_45080/g.97889 Transcript_45080/m.97889 type:complete len:379 (+) Transcript_45080:919-2055(+)
MLSAVGHVRDDIDSRHNGGPVQQRSRGSHGIGHGVSSGVEGHSEGVCGHSSNSMPRGLQQVRNVTHLTKDHHIPNHEPVPSRLEDRGRPRCRAGHRPRPPPVKRAWRVRVVAHGVEQIPGRDRACVAGAPEGGGAAGAGGPGAGLGHRLGGGGYPAGARAIDNGNAVGCAAVAGSQRLVVDVGDLNRPQVPHLEHVVHHRPRPLRHRHLPNLEAEIPDIGTRRPLHSVEMRPGLVIHRALSCGVPMDTQQSVGVGQVVLHGGAECDPAVGGATDLQHRDRLGIQNLNRDFRHRHGLWELNNHPHQIRRIREVYSVCGKRRCRGVGTVVEQVDGGIQRSVGDGEVRRIGCVGQPGPGSGVNQKELGYLQATHELITNFH